MSNPRLKLLIDRAKRLGVINPHKLPEDELEHIIREKGGSVPPKSNEPKTILGKAVEVKGSSNERPAQQLTPVRDFVHLSSPQQPAQIVVNVPLPSLNLTNHPAPAWWEIALEMRNALLYAIAGASGYALVLKLMQ